MKQNLMKAITLLSLYQSIHCTNSLLTNPTLGLASVSLFCLLTYGKELLYDVWHKKCVFRANTGRYNGLFEKVQDVPSLFVLKSKEHWEERGWCDNDINLIPNFLAKKYGCSQEEIFDKEFNQSCLSRDCELFCYNFYLKKIAIPSIGVCVGLLGGCISMYNFYINDYKL